MLGVMADSLDHSIQRGWSTLQELKFHQPEFVADAAGRQFLSQPAIVTHLRPAGRQPFHLFVGLAGFRIALQM